MEVAIVAEQLNINVNKILVTVTLPANAAAHPVLLPVTPLLLRNLALVNLVIQIHL